MAWWESGWGSDVDEWLEENPPGPSYYGDAPGYEGYLDPGPQDPLAPTRYLEDDPPGQPPRDFESVIKSLVQGMPPPPYDPAIELGLPAPLAGEELEAFKEQVGIDARALLADPSWKSTRTIEPYRNWLERERGEPIKKERAFFGRGVPRWSPQHPDNVNRRNIVRGHQRLIETHPPGSLPYEEYRQFLIDSGMFESDDVLADRYAVTPGYEQPMTLPDVLRKMYNVPKGQEVKQDDIPGRAKAAGIKARRGVKSEAYKEVMERFGGDMAAYNRWFHSLPKEIQVEDWEQARDAINLLEVGQRGQEELVGPPPSLAGDELVGPPLALAPWAPDPWAPGGWGDEPMAAEPGVTEPLMSVEPTADVPVTGRENLMSLAAGEMPEDFAATMPGEPADSWVSITDVLDPDYWPGVDVPTVSLMGGGPPGEPSEMLQREFGLPRWDEYGTKRAPPPGLDVFTEAGFQPAEAAELQRIAGAPTTYAGMPKAGDVLSEMAAQDRPRLEAITKSQARAASLNENLTKWSAIKDDIEQAQFFDMELPKEYRDIERQVKRDVSRIRGDLRRAGKRHAKFRNWMASEGIDPNPVIRSILTEHWQDVPGKNYQRQMGATQAEAAETLLSQRGPAGARSEVDAEVMRVAGSLPKESRARFLRETNWLRGFAAEIYTLGAAPRGGGTEENRVRSLGGEGLLNWFTAGAEGRLEEVAQQIRGTKARRGRKRLRRQLKER